MELIKTQAKQLITTELAASASEYAAILAVVVITFMVSISVVGRNMGRTVRLMDTRLAASDSSSAAQGSSRPAASTPRHAPSGPAHFGMVSVAQDQAPAEARPGHTAAPSEMRPVPKGTGW
jgi:hypothetical protein